VVGETGNGEEALQEVENLQPDILVLDLMMSGVNGFAVLQRLDKSARTKVVVLSMHSNDAYVAKALKLGTKACVLKDSAPGGFSPRRPRGARRTPVHCPTPIRNRG